jgi:alkylated DNA nucleotide flippase Atl1
VLGSGGKILLTGEPALEQRTRLALEGIEFRGAKVDVKKFGMQSS